MVRYSDELIDEIKSNNDIVEVISQYVVLKRSGRNYFGLCPFHKEKSPSFSVSPDKQIFHCFGCGVGGNVFHFISKIENINFRESVELLAERAGILLPSIDSQGDDRKAQLKKRVYEINQLAALFYHENLYKPSSKVAQNYVKKRKLDNQTLKNFLIGYSGTFNELYQFLKQKGYTQEEILASSLVNRTQNGTYIDRFRHRFMFPIQDVRGRVIAFGGRVLDDSKPKYINSPENIVYSKGRHLYGLYHAKKHELKKIIIVEGYMDAISLHQRGIPNVVASLGTALTENQGHLLKNNAEQIIIGYDADGAGQAATIRGLEILQNMGCDLRILQIEGAKDPDEFVTKYGSDRFKQYVEKAISFVEFKVKILKKELNIQNTSDKIKFLNETAKILAKVTNKMEQEVYIQNIANEYDVSKEAIYAQINKLNVKQEGSKILERKVPRFAVPKKEEMVKESTLKRENTILALLINSNIQTYQKIKEKIKPEDFYSQINQKILLKLYEEYEKGNSNIYDPVNLFTEETLINHITEIMAEDFGITDWEKAAQDVILSYQKERLIEKRDLILEKLNQDLTKEERADLEKRLSDMIIQIAKIK